MSSTMQSKLQFEVILSQTYSLFSLKLRIFGRNNFEQLFLLVFKRMLANKGKIRPAFYYLVLLIMFNFESHIQIDINIESLINEVSNNDIHEIINKNKSSLMTTLPLQLKLPILYYSMNIFDWNNAWRIQCSSKYKDVFTYFSGPSDSNPLHARPNKLLT